jgi:hypothetical protein
MLGISTNVVVGCLVGLMAAPAGVWVYEEARATYDRLNPVVSMSGVLVETTGQTVRIGIRGSKHRDCMYLRMVSYGVDSKGTRHDMHMARLSMAEVGDSKPVGNYDLGIWELVPRGDAKRVQVDVVHLCGSRTVRTMIADVALP